MIDWNDLDPSPIKRAKPKQVKERYSKDKEIRKLEKVVPNEELKEIGDSYGTKRRDSEPGTLCRVIPAEFVFDIQLLDMPKDNNIIPELAIPTALVELRRKLSKLKTRDKESEDENTY
jgi:hypothetical protein